MGKNSFLLPDELGWDCNDEIHAWVVDWMGRTAAIYRQQPTKEEANAIVTICIAELTDNLYAIIKKYQDQ